MAQTVLHTANSRGGADHGWLKSYHTFSFGGYYNPERINFGALRVLNDDRVDGGMGFGEHPHDNMEIISIPLEGSLEHKDSMGNTGVIEPGEIQVMSAGTGIYHAEYNKDKTVPVKFLQIWVFPNQRNVTPRYDQQKIKSADHANKLVQILSPDATDEGVWIHQDAWFNLGNLEDGKKIVYNFHKSTSGVYVFVLEGSVQVDGQELNTRDGFGVWDTAAIDITATADARILMMEVPMEF